MKGKGLLILSILFLSIQMQAQRPVGTWKSYRAFFDAKMTVETPNKVFAIFNSSLLSYSPDDEEVNTYSKAEGLSDINIQRIGYNSDEKALVLIYDNANIDIYMGKDEVYNLPFLKDNIYIQDKTINNLEMIGSEAYLSTKFGVIVIDLKRKEIKATYKLDANTYSICRWGDYFYVATSEGVMKALASSNLLDKGNWQHHPINFVGNEKNIHQLLVYQNNLILCEVNGIFYQNKDGEAKTLKLGSPKQVSILNNQLVVNGQQNITFYSDLTKSTSLGINANYISANNSNDNYWLAMGETGLVCIHKAAEANTYTTLVSGLTVNSPKRDLAYYLTYSYGKLLVVGGGRWENRLNEPGTLMVYENGSWFNFDEAAISEKTGLPCKDFTSVVVDPRDPSHYYATSWGEGLYEFKDKEFVGLYNYTNSALSSIYADNNRFIRVDGLTYDKNNNLYITNSGVQNGLVKLSADGTWKKKYISSLSGASSINQTLISRNNQRWFNKVRGSQKGIAVLDENDELIAASASFVDQQGTSTGATYFMCMTEDLNGKIWVGTDNGPILFSNYKQVEAGSCERKILTDSYGAGYYLLDGENISCIAIDGGNRKWLGTKGSGVFCVNDQSGQTISVENYNTSNSELISDNINSIAINNATGEVFIGTDKGLVSYMSDAISGQADYSEVYAFPNPVHPARNNQVVITGLMKDSQVKITDMGGNLITQGKSQGGQFTWDCSSRKGSTVKAGIYLVFAATPDGSEGVVTKIMVIK